MNDTPISAHGLTRAFYGQLAVSNVSFAVPRGQVFALLGRNGAGKTTTLRMLLGLLEPTAGEARLLGQTSRDLSPESRARIGFMAEGCALYDWMRVKECIAFQRAFYPRFDDETCRAVVDAFRLKDRQRVGELSHGQRAGLNLAVVLATEPEVLILDDPAMGLDPVARRLLLEAMVHFSQRDHTTILYSTHLLADVERVADGIILLERGALRACCTVDTFRRRVRRYAIPFEGEPPSLPDEVSIIAKKRFEQEMLVTVVTPASTPEGELPSALALLDHEVEPLPISFEDAAIAYLGHRGEVRFVVERSDA